MFSQKFFCEICFHKILSLLRIQCHISAQLCSPHLYQPKWMTYWQIPAYPPRSCSNDTFFMKTSWSLQLQDELFLLGWLYVFLFKKPSDIPQLSDSYYWADSLDVCRHLTECFHDIILFNPYHSPVIWTVYR